MAPGTARLLYGPGQGEVLGRARRRGLGRDEGRGKEGHQRELGRDPRLRDQRLLEALHAGLARDEERNRSVLVRLHEGVGLEAGGQAVPDGHVGREVGLGVGTRRGGEGGGGEKDEVALRIVDP